MGGICSKSANKPDNFSQPGRVLGASSQPSTRAQSAPVPKEIKTTTKGRTLGSGEGATKPEDAKSAAAKAAEARAAQASKGTGRLSRQLNELNKQNHKSILNSAAKLERRARDADQGAEARNWN